jgi:hypothetical protein
MKMLGTLSFFAIALVPFTKKSAPFISKNIPNTKNKIFKNIAINFSFFH